MKRKIRKFLGKLIIYYLKIFAKISILINNPYVIGVAGSVGKSSTCSAIEAVLKKEKKLLHIHTNSETGVPLGILGLEKGDYSIHFWIKVIFFTPLKLLYLKKFEIVLIEMGIDDPNPPKNMSYLLSIVKPQIGIITHESATHTEQFSKILTKKEKNLPNKMKEEILIEALTKEDFLLLKNKKCQYGIVNTSNKFINNELQINRLKNIKIAKTGKKDNDQIIFDNYQINRNSTIFSYFINSENKEKQKISLKLKNYLLPQEYQIIFAQAIAVGLIFKISLKKIINNLENNFKIPKGRSSLFINKKSQIIVDSSYNASKEAVFSLLNLTQKLAEQNNYPIVIILADMLELGPLTKSEHLTVGRASLKVADSLLLVGSLTKKYIFPMHKQYPNKIQHFQNLNELRKHLKNINKKSTILFKGSQGQLWLEEALKILIDKNEYNKLCRQDEFWKKVKEKKNLWFS